MQKQTQFNIMGMMRDMSVSHFNPNYAYENMNLRLIILETKPLFLIRKKTVQNILST